MEIMVETVFRIMKALNYYPRFVLREVEPSSFNCPEQASTRGGGYSGRASALLEEEKNLCALYGIDLLGY